eukprot:TRINITY_DN1551_c0_g1_i1.p1 TRINITY_DN1551_c0_g1~~TRINITY_DN1551_c0_g1_i1.p1  ORF type:complete len:660 (-),score=63.48 TRINITY_DN1551_c0_g1_i1:95-2008(-)
MANLKVLVCILGCVAMMQVSAVPCTNGCSLAALGNICSQYFPDPECGGNTCGGVPNAVSTVLTCAVSQCAAGFADCNRMYGDGCEISLLADPSNCGACNSVCSSNNGVANCHDGSCGLDYCLPGFADCNNMPSDGCETILTTDPGNCGQCGSSCAQPNFNGWCQNGQCTGTCQQGWGDCDHNPINGCETELSFDEANCGQCGRQCGPGAECVQMSCLAPQCSGFIMDCNPNVAGCETNTATDVHNCGQCGKVCTAPNGTPGCSNGVCTVPSCNAGFRDCDGMSANGCEVNTQTSMQNCGSCGNVCFVAPNTHAQSASCVQGNCQIASCSSGFADCDGNPANGCEVNLMTNPQSCGQCGQQCTSPNGTPSCTNGVCAVAACNAGFRDCDGMASNGCEVNKLTDAQNCGVCGNVCFFPPSVHVQSSACVQGNCQIASCSGGFADCDGNLANGCEVNLLSNPQSCGQCANACSAPNAQSSCVQGTCQIASCNAGFADCDNNPVNGCEVNLMTNPQSCGQCGQQCNLLNAASSCANGQCNVLACFSGYSDCDNDAANGCETSVTSSPTNCGGCNIMCPAGPNAQAVCNQMMCSTVCESGFGNCDGNQSNGCEVNLANNSHNCGACGNFCPANSQCINGGCF